MAKYRKVDTKIWNDRKFNSLSAFGKLAFLFILTHPNMTPLGAMRGTIEGLFSELKEVPLKAFREAFAKSFVKYSEKDCFIWLPNFLKYNQPESPNVVKSWAGSWDALPECQLKDELFLYLKDYTEALTEGFRKAFVKAIAKAMPNQEQEQEQDNKEVQEFLSDSVEYKFANYLLRHILRNNPKYKKPDLQKWAKTIDLMLRIDKRQPDDIESIIKWCQNDTSDKQPEGSWKGWAGNILSASSLREKFDKLYIKMQEAKQESHIKVNKPLTQKEIEKLNE